MKKPVKEAGLSSQNLLRHILEMGHLLCIALMQIYLELQQLKMERVANVTIEVMRVEEVHLKRLMKLPCLSWLKKKWLERPGKKLKDLNPMVDMSFSSLMLMYYYHLLIILRLMVE